MRTGREKAQFIQDALERIDLVLLEKDDLWTGVAGLRDAVNNAFRGSPDAAKASSFVDRKIPYGSYPAAASVEAIRSLVEALRAGKNVNW